MLSVLLCTLNRPELIKSSISSFLAQTYNKFEIVVIDQSADDRTAESCSAFQDPRIKYHHVDFTGLSKARNYGLKYCSGEYICLGDDDAVYDKDYLRNAAGFLKGKSCKYILCGRLKYIDKENTDCYDYDRCEDGQILRQNDLMRIEQSPALILPAKRLTKIGGFDEDFGVGAKYGSGEESDAVLRLLHEGAEARYISGMIVYHGKHDEIADPDPDKLYKYYVGLGALLKKHIIYRRDRYLLPKLARATAGAYVKWITGDRQQKDIYTQRIKGFNKGFTTYRQ